MSGGSGVILIWILVFFGIFYFLAIRPQRRQRQQHANLVAMLKKGDQVVTIGGMFGTVTAIGDDWVELEVARGTRVRYLKRAIASVTAVDEEDEDEDEYIDAEDADVEVAEEELEVAEEEPAAEVGPAAPEEAPEAPQAPKS